MNPVITPPFIRAMGIGERNMLSNAHSLGIYIAPNIFIPREWSASPKRRAQVISFLTEPGDVASGPTALWIYTGLVTAPFQRGLELSRNDARRSRGAQRLFINSSDINEIGGMLLTTPERTAIDLLIKDLASGTEYMMALIRAGADLTKIRNYTYRSIRRRGLPQVRDFLDQFQRVYESLPAVTNQ